MCEEVNGHKNYPTWQFINWNYITTGRDIAEEGKELRDKWELRDILQEEYKQMCEDWIDSHTYQDFNRSTGRFETHQGLKNSCWSSFVVWGLENIDVDDHATEEWEEYLLVKKELEQ